MPEMKIGSPRRLSTLLTAAVSAAAAVSAVMLPPSSSVTGAAAAASQAKASAASAKTARVRIVHAMPNAPALDVYVGSRKVLTAIHYKKVTGYLPLPGATQAVRFTKTGATEPLLELPVTVKAGQSYTVAATGTVKTARGVLVHEDTKAASKGYLRVVHLGPDAPPVDVFLVKPSAPAKPAARAASAAAAADAGQRVAKSLAYGKAAAPAPLAPGSYLLEVRPSGKNFLPIADNIAVKAASAGSRLTAFAVGLTKEEKPRQFTVLIVPEQ